jgi:hypothetical protein
MTVPSSRDATTSASKSDNVQAQNLATFDKLDFESWNKKDMPLFKEIHAEDVLVHYPDGTTTKGIKAHVDWANGFFASFDASVTAHPIKVASGEWTSVVGDMTATMARPMKTPDGKTIPATKKTWKGQMCTVAKWKDGRIVEELLFWDSGAMMKGVGLA